MNPAAAAKHTTSTATILNISPPSPTEDSPSEVALAGVPFEAPDVIDAPLLPVPVPVAAEAPLEVVNVGEVGTPPPMPLVPPLLLALVAEETPFGEPVVVEGVEAV